MLQASRALLRAVACPRKALPAPEFMRKPKPSSKSGQEQRLPAAPLTVEPVPDAETASASASDLPRYEDLSKSHALLERECERLKMALATAAHELKTPLAIMSGYIDLLLSSKAGALNTRQRQILEDAQSNGGRLKQYIMDFLTYSALETGKLAMRLEVADLNSCLQEIYGFWLPLFQKKKLALYLTVNPEVEPFPFDYHKIQQVLSNLLENARKHTPAGGTVWINAEAHSGDSAESSRERIAPGSMDTVRVSVADTGPGIPPEYHQEIFNEFYKVNPVRGESEGLGLGLAIARRLLRAHGGKIWVESDQGSGTKFTILLPVESAAVYDKKGVSAD